MQKNKNNAIPNHVPNDLRQEKPARKPPNQTSPESTSKQQVHCMAPISNPSTKAGQNQVLEVSKNLNITPSNTGESETSEKITPGIQMDQDQGYK